MKKKIFFIFLFFLLLFSFSILTSQALAIDPATTGLNKTAARVGAFQSQIGSAYDTGFLATKTGQLIGTILSFIGVIFLILIIYAGIMWMTAGGNETTVEKAKKLIINALIGLVIILAAYSITSFVGSTIIF